MIFSRTKRTFEVTLKTFFQVSQVLSFRLKEQTGKNAKDTSFKSISRQLLLTTKVSLQKRLMKTH